MTPARLRAFIPVGLVAAMVYAGKFFTSINKPIYEPVTIPPSLLFGQGCAWGEFETENDTNASGRKCIPTSVLNKGRQELIRSMCETIDPNKSYPNRVKSWKEKKEALPIVYNLIENTDMKMFFCLVNPDDVMSTLQFFSSMNQDRKLPVYSASVENGNVSLHLDTEDFIPARPGKHGLGREHHSDGTYRMIRTMPLQPALKKYRDYRKLLIVKHPLKRLVGAYFEVRATERESFRDFVQNKVLTWRGEHWLDYQSSCHPCLMEYDFVLHQESIDAEVPYFGKQLGLNSQYPYRSVKVRESGNATGVNGYDAMLSDLEKNEPDVFSRILRKYQTDMDMFGYYWKDHSSGRFQDSNAC